MSQVLDSGPSQLGSFFALVSHHLLLSHAIFVVESNRCSVTPFSLVFAIRLTLSMTPLFKLCIEWLISTFLSWCIQSRLLILSFALT